METEAFTLRKPRTAGQGVRIRAIVLEQQVRIEGRVERTTATESDDYFHTRPATSRIGA